MRASASTTHWEFPSVSYLHFGRRVLVFEEVHLSDWNEHGKEVCIHFLLFSFAFVDGSVLGIRVGTCYIGGGVQVSSRACSCRLRHSQGHSLLGPGILHVLSSLALSPPPPERFVYLSSYSQ
ncbi:hypothetical protein G7K_6723-t1 [Saitoella complicata NRRL Y-17804]|uniref:Uncharacterized protein n=1 Tax=Saitoella complicata (strain BCRC 22490 / CBS 7301 / JCM 7358 / NBRC 10748 / NRRL Y-17804) TaxID=698492 RepID=A0A0E9NSK3_SAICN|nr:hypothetical protein G7K_6723-t1 [Saitoella complicata NRRL Y-17804]